MMDLPKPNNPTHCHKTFQLI